MAKINKAIPKTPIYTHGGARAVWIGDEAILRRSVLATLLWEDQFYEEGESIADRIFTMAQKVNPEKVAALAIEARHKLKLRHAPLLLLVALTKTAAGRADGLVRKTIERVIDRADELTEFMAIYRKMGGVKLSGQVKKGLAAAFNKFDAYGLKKYDRDAEWKLRDVAFLAHVKPKDREHALNIARLVNKERFPDNTKASTFPVAASLHPAGFEKLKPADTWEVALSGGRDKKEYWTEALEKTASDEFIPGSLGYLALLRNLRNMQQAGVDDALIRKALAKRRGVNKVLPFRFISAAKHAPKLEDVLDEAMLASLGSQPKLPGKTIVIVDVSGSMGAPLSRESEMDRMHAAAALAAIAREISEHPAIYATAGSDYTGQHKTKLVPARRGMALIDAIRKDTYRELGGGGIFLTPVIRHVLEQEKTADRIIVITDEQDTSTAAKDKPSLAAPFGTKGNYLINVGGYRNGIGYGKWTHIDGFSESVIRYIREVEGLDADTVAEAEDD